MILVLLEDELIVISGEIENEQNQKIVLRSMT